MAANSITWLSVSQNYWYVVWCKISLHHVDLSVQHIVILSPCKRRQQLGVWESCPSTSGLVCYCRFIHVLGLCSHGLCVCLEQSCRWTPKATIITGQGHYVFWCVREREIDEGVLRVNRWWAGVQKQKRECPRDKRCLAASIPWTGSDSGGSNN